MSAIPDEENRRVAGALPNHWLDRLQSATSRIALSFLRTKNTDMRSTHLRPMVNMPRLRPSVMKST